MCATIGIVFNVKKFQFCQDTVDFAGLTITSSGVVPSNKMLSVIRDFPSPKDLTGARSWFGLVNQVAWGYSTSPVMAPFRDLIKPNRKFYWDANLEKIFQDSKVAIITLVVGGVQTFDISKRTGLQTDWSQDALGYLLLQKHCKCAIDSPVCCKGGWKLIFAGSRFTKSAESRYSPTEGEALALVWALSHSRIFTLGCKNLPVAVDHKPLLGIFNDRDLSSNKNPRILDIKESCLAWRFSIIHCPGKWTRGPDALSRQPVVSSLSNLRSIPSEQDVFRCDAIHSTSQIAAVCAVNELTSITLDNIRNAAHLDSQYQDFLQIIRSGCPCKRNLTEPAPKP